MVTKGFWTSEDNIRKFFDWLKGPLNIKQNSDWKKVKLTDIASHGGITVLKQFNNDLFKLLRKIYPGMDIELMNE